jgi:hypothetical protein
LDTVFCSNFLSCHLVNKFHFSQSSFQTAQCSPLLSRVMRYNNDQNTKTIVSLSESIPSAMKSQWSFAPRHNRH